jgi:hypothetical protein
MGTIVAGWRTQRGRVRQGEEEAAGHCGGVDDDFAAAAPGDHNLAHAPSGSISV